MSNERSRILNMLAEGKITAEEAEKLLDALEHGPDQGTKDEEERKTEPKPGDKPKYLCIVVRPKSSEGDKVDIKIPLQIIRAGVKLKSILPESARDRINTKFIDKGIGLNINDIDSRSLEELLQSLKELSIDVEDGNETVKIYCC